MASIIQRGKSWRAMIFRQGKRLQATFSSKKAAEEWAYIQEGKLLTNSLADISNKKNTNHITVSNYMDRYVREITPTKKGAVKESLRIHHLKKYPVFNILVDEFSARKLAAWRDFRLQSVSPSTVNRDLNLLSAIFSIAIKEWGAPFSVNPVWSIQRPKNPSARKRRVTFTERQLIASALGWDMQSAPSTTSQWVAFAFFLALETAMRRGEILSIRYDDVFFDKRYVHLSSTKNGEERDVPLSSEAIALLKLLPKMQGNSLLIPVSANNLTIIFMRTVRSLGIHDMHFHDSRREASTVLSKKLSNVIELSAVTGHKSLSVLKGYYRPDPSDLAKKLM